MKGLGIVLFVLTAGTSAAGNVYGTLRENNKAVAGAQLIITGQNFRVNLTTGADGSYRIFIRDRGKFHLLLNYQGRRGDADIFSYDDPVKYDFDLRFDPPTNSYQLHRR